MTRAVVDTNVIISALFWRGAPHRVVKLGLDGAFMMLVSDEIIHECLQKLVGKFRYPFHDAVEYLEIITAGSEIIESVTRVEAVRADPSDNKILSCGVDGEADFIVTGDKDLLSMGTFRGIHIIDSTEFLRRLSI